MAFAGYDAPLTTLAIWTGGFMPSRDADGFRAVQFRDRRSTAVQERHTLLGIGSTIFIAVLLALCAHDLIRLAVIGAATRDFTRQMESELKQLNVELERQAQAAEPLSRAYQQPVQTQRPAVARYVGPIEANAIGSNSACMGGRTAVRIPNGWRTTSQPCIATSQ